MHHGVGVFHADAVRTEVALHHVHDGVVSVALSPVALPLEHRGKSGDGLCAGLDNPAHRVVVSQLADVATAILGDINLIAIVDHLNGWQSDTGLGLQASEHDFLPAGFFDCRNEVLVVPRIHRGALDGLLIGKDRFELRPHVPAEALRLDGSQHNRHFEDARCLTKGDGVVDDGLPVEIRSSEQHLGLMVDERHDTVIRCQESFFAPLLESICL